MIGATARWSSPTTRSRWRSCGSRRSSPRGWSCARGRRRALSARAFAAYLTPSAALVTLGALLLALGASPPSRCCCSRAGLAIREAMVPAHSWFPSFVEKAPMGLVVAFVAPQVGVYAHLRWLAAGLPPQLEDVIAALGAITVVLAARSARSSAAPAARSATS
ncbi:MAG: hypothetical protein H6719_15445 [Sandaracinaceae bacterium]|nr:hypothetical protein [Sandaracinaceae bacterium]